ncbi:MAG: Type 1 glutamine amidotransferase-like domain-containing protein [bacterium]|nr:Type 1 glutamine amidotransferase-like domain-containing protein [bacterium]
MRLYLSSYKLGNKPEELVALAGDGRRAAVILNALDNYSETRNRFLASQIADLAKLGFAAEELDLRKYFGRPEELKKILDEKDLVWINGGNTFVLRRAMKQSGFDRLITERVKEDSIVYAGFSAAVCAVTSDLHGLEITDDPNEVPSGYEPEILWDGLGFIDFAVAVHYKSDHPESHLTDKEVEYYQANHIPYKTLKDGQALIKQGDEIRIVG